MSIHQFIRIRDMPQMSYLSGSNLQLCPMRAFRLRTQSKFVVRSYLIVLIIRIKAFTTSPRDSYKINIFSWVYLSLKTSKSIQREFLSLYKRDKLERAERGQ